VSGVDEREPPLGQEPDADPDPVVASALPPRPAPAGDDVPDDVTDDAGWPLPPPEPPAHTGWPTTPAEIPLDGRHALPEAQLPPAPPARAPQRHSRNPVDRLTRRLPDPLRVIVDWLVTIVGAVAIVLLVKAYVVNPYRIPSSSMEPTLHCAQPASGCEARFSDRVLANRFIYHVRDPRRGEIVVFDTPDAARVKCGAGGTFVKRLIGLPGETLEVRLRRGEGYVFVNGRELDEPYIGDGRRSTEEFGPVKVPQNAYFMMGDNRSQSCDSREWGSVPRQNLIGKVFATYWPPNRIAVR
jgi:signal peptidase I